MRILMIATNIPEGHIWCSKAGMCRRHCRKRTHACACVFVASTGTATSSDLNINQTRKAYDCGSYEHPCGRGNSAISDA